VAQRRNRGSGLDVAATTLTDLLLVPLSFVPLVFGVYAGCCVRFGLLQGVSSVIVAAGYPGLDVAATALTDVLLVACCEYWLFFCSNHTTGNDA
jgi:hypothetical protein